MELLWRCAAQCLRLARLLARRELLASAARPLELLLVPETEQQPFLALAWSLANAAKMALLRGWVKLRAMRHLSWLCLFAGSALKLLLPLEFLARAHERLEGRAMVLELWPATTLALQLVRRMRLALRSQRFQL